MSRMSFNYKNYNIIVVVVLARDILACFAGKSTESNRAFYEFMIYRNVQYHGDSRQKIFIMQTTNNRTENKLFS